MATDFENIVTIRLSINDPQNVINILAVDESADLPASPAPQTAYRAEDTGYYYITDKTSGAIESDYEHPELFLSDAQILTLYTNLGTTAKAACRALKLIASKIGAKIPLVKTTSGSESAEYSRILDLYQYYKALAADCAEINNSDNYNDTGKFVAMKQPEIGGGNL